MSQDNALPPQPGSRNNVLFALLIIVFLFVAGGAGALALTAVNQRDTIQDTLDTALTAGTLIANREQDALATAAAEAANAEMAVATAVAALNQANGANNIAATEAARASAAEGTAQSAIDLSDAAALTADAAQYAAATAYIAATFAFEALETTEARASLAEAGATAAQATSLAVANAIAEIAITATAAQAIADDDANTALTQVAIARATAGSAIVENSQMRATLAEVSSSLDQLARSATQSAAPAAPLATEAAFVPDDSASSTLSEAGVASIGVNQGRVPEGGAEVWVYYGAIDEVISLVVEADYPVTVALFDREVDLLNLSDDEGRDNYARIGDVTLSETGLYVIVVTGEFRLYDGPYTLRVTSSLAREVEATPARTPFVLLPTATSELELSNAGEAVAGENTGRLQVGDTDVWIYAGRAGESVTIELQADWDTTLALLSEGAEVLDYNDDIEAGVNRQSRIEYTFEETGPYFLLVSSFLRQSGGPYTLIITSRRQGL